MIPLFIVAFLAATEPPSAPPDLTMQIACNAEVCVVPRALVTAMMEAHNQHVEEIRKLEEQVKHPKCADATVVEPSKGIK